MKYLLFAELERHLALMGTNTNTNPVYVQLSVVWKCPILRAIGRMLFLEEKTAPVHQKRCPIYPSKVPFYGKSQFEATKWCIVWYSGEAGAKTKDMKAILVIILEIRGEGTKENWAFPGKKRVESRARGKRNFSTQLSLLALWFHYFIIREATTIMHAAQIALFSRLFWAFMKH